MRHYPVPRSTWAAVLMTSRIECICYTFPALGERMNNVPDYQERASGDESCCSNSMFQFQERLFANIEQYWLVLWKYYFWQNSSFSGPPKAFFMLFGTVYKMYKTSTEINLWIWFEPHLSSNAMHRKSKKKAQKRTMFFNWTGVEIFKHSANISFNEETTSVPQHSSRIP